VHLTGILDAPRELVFIAWTEPKNTLHSGGGRAGFSNPVCKLDLRVGGASSSICVHLTARAGVTRENCNDSARYAGRIEGG